MLSLRVGSHILCQSGPCILSKHPLGVGLQIGEVYQHLCRRTHQLLPKKVILKKNKVIVSLTWVKATSSSSSSSSSTTSDNSTGSWFEKSQEAANTSKGKENDIRSRPDGYYTYHDNTFITQSRAKADYLLKKSDVDSLPIYHNRTPYTWTQQSYILMVRKMDVEAKAREIWGSMEVLEQEKKRLQENLSQPVWIRMKIKLKETWKGVGQKTVVVKPNIPPGQKLSADFWRVLEIDYPEPENTGFIERFKILLKMPTFYNICLASFVNVILSVMKFQGFAATGSHSMFAEGIHSLADTLNQLALAIGLLLSLKKSDHEHPYGFRSLRHITSLISGVGIFWLGAGVSFYHGVNAITNPAPLEGMLSNLWILGGAFIAEGASLALAIHHSRIEAKSMKMTLLQYIHAGVNPNLNVVVLEDASAMVGVLIAGGCMGITHYTSNPIYDAMGSFMIGALLACTSSYIIHANSQTLIGRSLRDTRPISTKLESDRMVKSVLDIKATEMGEDSRFKCEVNYDGKQIALDHLRDENMEEILAEIKAIQTHEDVERFLGNHGDNVVNHLAKHIDRLETQMKKDYPKLRHIDMEPS